MAATQQQQIQWPSARFLVTPSSAALTPNNPGARFLVTPSTASISSQTSPSTAAAIAPFVITPSIGSHAVYSHQAAYPLPTGYTAQPQLPHQMGYYRSASHSFMTDMSSSCASMMSRDSSMNTSNILQQMPIPIQPKPASTNKPAPLQKPPTTIASQPSVLQKTQTSTPTQPKTATDTFCFTDQLPPSPIISPDDLTAELANFHDFFNFDASDMHLSRSDMRLGSSIEADYAMSQWDSANANAAKPEVAARPTNSMLSLLGDVHGSIGASDLELETSRSTNQRVPAAAQNSLHLNSDTSVWDSSAGSVNGSLPQRWSVAQSSLHLNSDTSVWDSSAGSVSGPGNAAIIGTGSHNILAQELHRITQCSFCHKVCKSKAGLTRHLAVCGADAAANRRYCAICDRRFTSERTCRMHKKKQHGTNNECTICSASFNTALQLRNHMGMHRIGVKQMNCWKCGETFPTRYRHRKHMRVCEATSKFACGFCGEDFPSVFCRKKHMVVCAKRLSVQ